MENIINYVKTQSNPFNIKEFNAVDSLILSQISNIVLNNFVGSIDSIKEHILFKDLLKTDFSPEMFNVPYGESIKKLLFYSCSSPRFKEIRINYYISKNDPISEKQFSAITFILNNKYAYIGFAGTDFSIIGWKEDFNMSLSNAVPSQLEGVDYVNTVAKLIPHDLYIGGHSKGGNIAIYASMNCHSEISNRIKKIYSHDSPGFRDEIIKSEAFNKIKNKIHRTLPHSSIIGMLFENQEGYHVVKSNGLGGINQHNPFSWKVKNSNFIYLDKISLSSKHTSDSLHKLIDKLSDEKRKVFIDSLFDIFSATDSESFIEIAHNWKKNIPIILDSLKTMDEEMKSIIIQLIKALL